MLDRSNDRLTLRDFKIERTTVKQYYIQIFGRVLMNFPSGSSASVVFTRDLTEKNNQSVLTTIGS